SRIVDRASKRHTESRKMRAAVHCIDVVGEAKYRLRIPVVILHANFHDHAAALLFHVNRLVMQDLLAAIQMLNEFRNATGVFELGGFWLASFGIGRALV